MAQNTRPRLRDIGLTLGTLPTGPLNAITGVPGVRVGHTTLIEGDGPFDRLKEILERYGRL